MDRLKTVFGIGCAALAFMAVFGFELSMANTSFEAFDEHWVMSEPLASFKACEESGRVVVAWETASERGTVGFYLEREDALTGSFRRLNDELFPGLISSPQGGVYRYLDGEAEVGKTYTYRIVQVQSRGPERTLGRYTITVRPKAPDHPAPGLPGKASAWLDDTAGIASEAGDDLLVSGYSRTPRGIAPGRRARLEAMMLEKGATAIQNADGLGIAASTSGRGRITVTDNGLYFLDAAGISSALGMSVATVKQKIRLGLLRLTHRGASVAYAASPAFSGLFFYGEGIDNIYTRENVYWLDNAGRGLRIKNINGKRPKPLGGKTFNDTLHFEKDLLPATSLFHDPQSDYLLWDYVIAGNSTLGSKTFRLNVPGAARSGQANMKVSLLGNTTTNHHVVVALNGTTIGEGQWFGTVAASLDLPFNPSLLVDGNNTVQVTGVLDSGVRYSVFYLESFDVSYARRYRAEGGQLACRGAGNPVVTVQGFNNSDISVYELSDPKTPKKLQEVVVDRPRAGKYRASFVPTSALTPYLAVDSSGVKTPKALVSAETSTLRRGNNQADYLVITPSQLKASAMELADYRSSRGLESMVVDFQTVLDEFNYGIYSPQAIRDFLAYAHGNWETPPRYVMLVGGGTYDYKNEGGFGDNLLPPLLVDTPYGLFSSDVPYVEGVDGVPQMAIGRLPVLTADELSVVTGKIKGYESSSGSWTERVLMVADNADPDGDFTADSDTLFNLLPPEYQNPDHKIYLEAGNAAQARTKLLDAITSGALLLNYIGHAAFDRLAAENVLVSADVSGFTNGAKLPVMTAMTCLVGEFAIPGYDSLTELLVLHPVGGALAAWAATGLSENDPAVSLDRGFFKALFIDGKKVLGDAVLSAQRDYALGGHERFIYELYNLLGDPATEMKLGDD